MVALFSREHKDRYAVFGNPVRHSLSPRIHTAFARETGEPIRYRSHLVRLGRFEPAVRHFFSGDGRGLNITVPFKIEAFKLADELGPRAELAGAVNTLSLLGDGRVHGDNTDGVGLVRDIADNLNWDIEGQKVLILGAGGGVRGILGPLLECQPERVVICNRSVDRAVKLARSFSARGDVRGCSYAAIAGSQFDLVINGTSASMQGELPPLPTGVLSDAGSCYDMMYGAQPSPFMRWAAGEAAWAVSDGLGMLVEQAAESFYIWRGVRPQTAPVIENLRERLRH